jgi:hypothetical protein
MEREKSQLDSTHVLGTLMPIIRSSRLYRWLQHVAHDTLFKASCVVWCGAVGYASGLKRVAQRVEQRNLGLV